MLNLSAFYEQTENPTRDFLARYLKLTHCDLFFADAAVLVEGNVERLLLPQMIAKVAPQLQSVYLSILEIGGAFGHRFRTLIEYLGITALIVTDIDSVTAPAEIRLISRPMTNLTRTTTVTRLPEAPVWCTSMAPSLPTRRCPMAPRTPGDRRSSGSGPRGADSGPSRSWSSRNPSSLPMRGRCRMERPDGQNDRTNTGRGIRA